MPAHLSDPGDLALHGPRVLGFASARRIAERFGIDRTLVEDRLLDFEARGWVWDERARDVLQSLDVAVRRLGTRLTERLQRFGGYADRYSTALARVDAGERRWVDAPEVDSCHTVWIQLHEDLLATLGRQRGSDA
jgi:hypothetical protein